MRWHALLTCTVLLALSLASSPASAGEGRGPSGFTGNNCSVDSDYDLRVDAGGLWLEADADADADADAARPRRIAISDGTLVIDGRPREVSPADAARLRAIESGARGMLPDILAIGREAIGITFDTLGGVNLALAGKRRQARDFEAMRERALARVDDMEARGEWSSDAFGDEFEAEIEAAAEAMAASFTPGRAIWMVVSGGIGRMERRMEKMEAELEQSMVEREAALERHSLALCDRLESLQRLQDAMELRVDGEPLRVFEVRRDHSESEPGLAAAGGTLVRR